MSNLAIIGAGLCSLTLMTWAVLRHRRAEVSKYPLTWVGWSIRLAFVAVGIMLLFGPGEERHWRMFAGAALVSLPVMFRQISYEIETRLALKKTNSRIRQS